MHKVLEDAGIKLTSVATRLLGASGRAMLDALLAGTTDPAILAELAGGKLCKKLPALRQAFTGRFRPQHAFLVSQLLAHLDYLDEAIDTVSGQIDVVMAPFADHLAQLDTHHRVDPGSTRQVRRRGFRRVGVRRSVSDERLARPEPVRRLLRGRIRARTVGPRAPRRNSSQGAVLPLQTEPASLHTMGKLAVSAFARD
ncbi:MAG TPA: hypothetical protein VKE73_11115 [Myxococcota bacterium]|nr:hypothetical protein [Myxococcota bacterium]